MHDNTCTDFCQNCVLGLQWNMTIKSKVENLKKNKKKKKQTNKQTKYKKCLRNYRHELRSKPMQNGKEKIQDLK